MNANGQFLVSNKVLNSLDEIHDLLQLQTIMFPPSIPSNIVNA